MHNDVPLTSSRVCVAILPLVVVAAAAAVTGAGGGVASGGVASGGVARGGVAGGGVAGSGIAGVVDDRGRVRRNRFISRGPARRLIAEKNFIKGKFDSRTRNTERIVGSRGVEPFAVVHRIRQSRCGV